MTNNIVSFQLKGVPTKLKISLSLILSKRKGFCSLSKSETWTSF